MKKFEIAIAGCLPMFATEKYLRFKVDLLRKYGYTDDDFVIFLWHNGACRTRVWDAHFSESLNCAIEDLVHG